MPEGSRPPVVEAQRPQGTDIVPQQVNRRRGTAAILAIVGLGAGGALVGDFDANAPSNMLQTAQADARPGDQTFCVAPGTGRFEQVRGEAVGAGQPDGSFRRWTRVRGMRIHQTPYGFGVVLSSTHNGNMVFRNHPRDWTNTPVKQIKPNGRCGAPGGGAGNGPTGPDIIGVSPGDDVEGRVVEDDSDDGFVAAATPDGVIKAILFCTRNINGGPKTISGYVKTSVDANVRAANLPLGQPWANMLPPTAPIDGNGFGRLAAGTHDLTPVSFYGDAADVVEVTAVYGRRVPTLRVNERELCDGDNNGGSSGSSTPETLEDF